MSKKTTTTLIWTWVKKIVLFFAVFILHGETYYYIALLNDRISEGTATATGYYFALAATIVTVYVWNRFNPSWLKK